MADRIGFCFGVKRAVTMAEDALKRNMPVYSLGSIIHNRQVVSGLSRKGLTVVKDITGIRSGAIVISSHGIDPKAARMVSRRRLELIDTTCPFVSNAQRIAKSLSDSGYKVIIVGDKDHPEVKALVGFVSKDVAVVKDRAQARALKLGPNDRISIISQTTQSAENFSKVVKAVIDKRPKEMKVINTICNDASERQAHAATLAKAVDTMLVVGGRDSANTRRLFEVCKRILKNSHLVETERELEKSWFKPSCAVGVASGASTPDWIVGRVVKRIKTMRKGGRVIDG